MAVELRYGAQTAGWRTTSGGLTLMVPVPVLAGAESGILLPGDVILHEEAPDCVHAETACGHFVALKMPIAQDLAATSERLYDSLLTKLDGLSLLRIWNFVPAINMGEGEAENYQRFCTGRARGFAGRGVPLGAYPAASAVGCQGDALLTFAVATTEPEPIHFENPLQVPAFHYPKEYGPDAPAFSRATACGLADGALFVSGTASVRGHLTVHPGELAGQLTVTAENLRAILGAAKRAPGGGEPSWCCAYVRRAEDAAPVEDWLRAQGWARLGRYTLVQSDICRKDLMVEVELSWSPGRTACQPDALEAARG